MCGALGPGRERFPSRRVCIATTERSCGGNPPIGSGHYIHTFLFPISTAALLSGDRTNQCVWDGEAPRRGLVIEHDLRKSQLSGFFFGERKRRRRGVIIWQLRPHLVVLIYIFLLVVVFFFSFLPHHRFYFRRAKSHLRRRALLGALLPQRTRDKISIILFGI